jgi:hypothetical protein
MKNKPGSETTLSCEDSEDSPYLAISFFDNVTYKYRSISFVSVLLYSNSGFKVSNAWGCGIWHVR